MISVIFEFITRIFIWIIQNIFEMITFFMRQLFRLLRFFVALLPVTGILYTILFLLLTLSLLGVDIPLSELPVTLNTVAVKKAILGSAVNYLSMMNSYGGTLLYFVFLLLLLILLLPVACVLIAVGTFAYSFKLLMLSLLIDAFIYLVPGVIFGRGPFHMFMARYKLLFPGIGHKIDQHSYNRWLRKHSVEFQDDSFGQNKKHRRADDFYEDEQYDHSEYDSYNENDFYEDENFIEDQYIDNDRLEDRYAYEYYDDDEDYDAEDYDDEDYDDEDYDDEVDYDYNDEKYDEDDTYGKRSRRRHQSSNNYRNKSSDNRRISAASANTPSSFDFFAGCTTLESAERKYKSLVKLYHPDNMDGDTAALQEINVQYSKLKKQLGR